jgi:hypothetical protein
LDFTILLKLLLKLSGNAIFDPGHVRGSKIGFSGKFEILTFLEKSKKSLKKYPFFDPPEKWQKNAKKSKKWAFSLSQGRLK